MPAKMQKLWDQWSWAFQLTTAVIMVTAVVVTYRSSIAQTIEDVAALKQQHTEENMAVRMAVQEKTASDIRDDVKDIKMVQGKIFDRINALADRPR